jgi:hypothetical protein
MANDEILTDDYVASLLAKDAKESSIKYSALGLEGFAQSKYGSSHYIATYSNIHRPPANKPKPNTRFLRNIIKDTDSHNAALLAKEAAESRARLKDLASNGHREEKASRVGGGDIRRRQLGDIAAILGGSPRKRRRVEDENKERRRKNTSSEEDELEESRNNRNKNHRSRQDGNKEDRSSRSRQSHRQKRERSGSEERMKDRDHRRRDRSRSHSPREHRSNDSRHRHRSPKRKRSRSPEERSRGKSHRSHRSRRSPLMEPELSKKGGEKSTRTSEPKPDYDSDPLDDIIGPRPPPVPEVRSRGRGMMSGASGMDSRFSANYDPTADVQPDVDEENDWDQALEALRDRQKWKQQGADRLRAAGFTEDEVKKWENGGEKREEDVKWSKKGEGREWDRGKILDDEGIVTFEPSFGRLKDD